MATKVDREAILEGMRFALIAGAQLLENEIIAVTPRDPSRPPKDPSRPVTGHLKQSIGIGEVDKNTIRVGIRQGFFNTSTYGKYLEFGTIRMAPRSFIRKARFEKETSIKNSMQNAFTQYIRKRG